MAVHFRRPARPLIEDLRAEPYRYDLFQAIAILERVYRDESVPLGTGIDPDVESVRLEQEPGLSFPASDISSAGFTADGKTVLRTPVIGVSGLNGPLPYAFTEAMIERTARRDHAMAAFMNIFNHRVISLLYRIRNATMPLLDGAPAQTVTAQALRSFVGLGTPGLQERLPEVPDRALLGFAAIFADRRRSAEGLRVALAGIFDVDVKVRSFLGRWLTLEPESRTVLGPRAPVEARTLGVGALVGSRVWDQHGAFGVEMRFQCLERFEQFLPSGRHYKAVLSVCRFHAGNTCDIVQDLTLAAPAVPPLRIAGRDGAARLGWTTWLLGKSGRAETDGRVRLVSKVTETETEAAAP